MRMAEKEKDKEEEEEEVKNIRWRKQGSWICVACIHPEAHLTEMMDAFVMLLARDLRWDPRCL